MVRLFFSLPYSPPLFFSFLSIRFEIATCISYVAIFIDRDYRITPNSSELDQLTYVLHQLFSARLLFQTSRVIGAARLFITSLNLTGLRA